MKTDPSIWLREALSEARKGLGFTAPNPAVGAVVVRDGKIVGRGFHAKAGKPHAEPNALRDAGDAAKGAELYVTLEPCSTTGRTPPCTEAIRQAGIRKVFLGCEDPNPKHAGRAVDLLRGMGIEVESGVLRDECQDLIRAFAHVQATGLPYVTLKLACTLDGRIADHTGASQWITGPESREQVQVLRREVDAILVGTETVRKDNPSLIPRPAYGHKPLRIIPDRHGRLPLTSKVFQDVHAKRTCCVLGPDVAQSRVDRLERQGVQVLRTRGKGKALAWKPVLKQLAAQDVNHILCEGGGQLSAALLKAGLIQEIHWIIAPKLLGESARPAVADSWRLAQAPGFQVVSVERRGDDSWIRLRV
jgi:diaminohydroxyphosphoribosylaminopyrimidine deaminase/5-amino-6-(5-phosphoribosylamino)uracil reductase